MVPERSGFNWRIPFAVGVALLIVGGVVGWTFMPPDSPMPNAYLQPAAKIGTTARKRVTESLRSKSLYCDRCWSLNAAYT